jgi:hypothetical protein
MNKTTKRQTNPLRQRDNIDRLRACGIPHFDVGLLWGCSANTACRKLNGYLSITKEEQAQLNKTLRTVEKTRKVCVQ